MHARAQTPRAIPNRAGRFLSPVYSEYRALRTLYAMLHLSTLNRITGLLYSFTLDFVLRTLYGVPNTLYSYKILSNTKIGWLYQTANSRTDQDEHPELPDEHQMFCLEDGWSV